MLAGMPLALVRSALETAVNLAANHKIARSRSTYFWEKTRQA